eukprot:CAMPEP_0202918736 /NCGR_PEP_ID=MMETSP1392-20130828/74171_1 /ASSEMBLY_ACC=CAM_ASM_000868 /TAXON_ID=225041 /ORGANISM="Chlamydomonas chlamydogama, Strain SAG 11-48b" /LENGTH=83 /DNA_ID=CAMNT_0049611881 /DNA_START=80 /DNA_END=328 /DNA_ORIENTATION=-
MTLVPELMQSTAASVAETASRMLGVVSPVVSKCAAMASSAAAAVAAKHASLVKLAPAALIPSLPDEAPAEADEQEPSPAMQVP